VILAHHINEINNDDATQIAQSQLPRNRLRRLQVGLEDRVIKIAGADEATRVDIHRRQRFRLIHNQITARLQFHPAPQRLGNFFINRIEIKNRALTPVMLQFLGRSGHELEAEGLE